MNVLLLHNRYRESGGEERSVAQIAALLRERGHEVELLERSSAGIGKRAAGTAMLSGGREPDEVSEAVHRCEANVVHAHNINPLFGVRALRAARAAGARVVMHLHNYRLVCAVATTYRDGDVCTDCSGRNTMPGVLHRCRGSFPEALVYATAISRQQPGVIEAVDQFLVPSRAAVVQLERLGLPTTNMSVLPNFVGADEFSSQSSAGKGSYAIYVGRLTEEKGIETAITATTVAGVELIVAGEGPDRRRLEAIAARAGSQVTFAGKLGVEELTKLRAGAAFMFAPSRWAEPCPYSVIEGMAAGLPVLASDIGGLTEMVGSAMALPVDDEARWVDATAELWADPALRNQRGNDALERARELFNAERFYSGLMDAYGSGEQ